MVTYSELRGDRRRFLALPGLTLPEFEPLLAAFARADERRFPADRTAAGRPRQRRAGGGRTAVLHEPAQKLLFLLIYLKTYPLQVVMAELFGLSQPQANYWLGRLLPILRDALDDLGALPERAGQAFAGAGPRPRLIIDGTERRRQRPKNPEKQAALQRPEEDPLRQERGCRGGGQPARRLLEWHPRRPCGGQGHRRRGGDRLSAGHGLVQGRRLPGVRAGGGEDPPGEKKSRRVGS